MRLNGKVLKLVDDHAFPDLNPVIVPGDKSLILPPMTFGFYVIQELLPVDAVNVTYWRRTVYLTNVNYRLNFHWPWIHVNEWDPHASQNNTVSLEVGLSQTLSWLIIASWTQPRKEKKNKKNNNSKTVIWFLGFWSFNLSNYEEFVSGFFWQSLTRLWSFCSVLHSTDRLLKRDPARLTSTCLNELLTRFKP